MSIDPFDTALRFVLAHEGGEVDHPSDPGGYTKSGISLRFFRQINPIATAADVKALTPPEIAEIYRAYFWWPARCDHLPPAIAFALFDTAVNMGVKTAAKFLQRAIGVTADGVIGQKTLDAIFKRREADTLAKFFAERNWRYGNLSTFQVFGKGWLRRSAACHSEALRLSHEV